MKDFIKKRLKEDLEYAHVDNAAPEQDEFKIGLKEQDDRYSALAQDIKMLIKKHGPSFAEYEGDSYGVINAFERVFSDMHQRL